MKFHYIVFMKSCTAQHRAWQISWKVFIRKLFYEVCLKFWLEICYARCWAAQDFMKKISWYPHSLKSPLRLLTSGLFQQIQCFASCSIGHGQKGGNYLPTIAVRWHHMFSVTFLPFLFLCVIWKKADLYKIWPNRRKTFFLLKVVSFLIKNRFY